MIRGDATTYPFMIKGGDNNSTNRQKIATLMQSLVNVDYYNIKDNGSIYYTLNPYGFINIYDNNQQRVGIAKANHVIVTMNIPNVEENLNSFTNSLFSNLTKLNNKIIIPVIDSIEDKIKSLDGFQETIEGLMSLSTAISKELNIDIVKYKSLFNIVIQLKTISELGETEFTDAQLKLIRDSIHKIL